MKVKKRPSAHFQVAVSNFRISAMLIPDYLKLYFLPDILNTSAASLVMNRDVLRLFLYLYKFQMAALKSSQMQ